VTLAGITRRAGDVIPASTRVTGRAHAPLWFMAIGSPDIAANMEALGLEPQERYFLARAAPLGRASATLVQSTFFNFSPLAVSSSIPHVWDKASPEEILRAQLEGVDVGLRKAFTGLDTGVLAEDLTLLRTAAQAASQHPEGRPLFAAYASLPWPGEPHLDLWHAHYLLREFRGDGHIAALTAEGITGIEALALHIAMLPAMGPRFRNSRGWTDDEWDDCVDGLRSEGWIDRAEDGTITLTEDGARRREDIEKRTDELDLPGWSAIGGDGCARVVELAAPVTEAMAAAGLGTMSRPAPPAAS
jgi:hypothetical protein